MTTVATSKLPSKAGRAGNCNEPAPPSSSAWTSTICSSDLNCRLLTLVRHFNL